MAAAEMAWVWNFSRSKNAARLVLLAIAAAIETDDSRAFCTVKELQIMAHLGSLRSVQDALKSLVELGEIEIRYNEGQEGQNVYRMLMPSAEPLGGAGILFPQFRCQTPAESAGGADSAGGVQNPPHPPADSAGVHAPQSPQANPDTPAESAGGPPPSLRGVSAPASPQASGPTPADSAGGRNKDARAHAQAGWLVGNTSPNQPTNPPGRAHASGIDEQAVDFMASLELKRTPTITEQAQISALFLAKLAAGFTVAEIRNSVASDWNGVLNRVRVLIARLERMPDRPLRRPARPGAAPRQLSECAECRVALKGPVAPDGLCVDCRADAEAAAADTAYRRARAALESVEPDERKNAIASARAEGLTDPRALEIRAAELLGEWNRLSYQTDSGA